MLNILDTIQEWIMGILKDCIMGNLNGMFDQITTEVGEVATNVGTTPAAWNAGVFSMIRNLSDNVVVPIAGMVLTFVMCYELISIRLSSARNYSIKCRPGGLVSNVRKTPEPTLCGVRCTADAAAMLCSGQITKTVFSNAGIQRWMNPPPAMA